MCSAPKQCESGKLTCAKRPVRSLNNQHCQVASHELLSVHIHLADYGAKAVVSVVGKECQLRPVVQEVPVIHTWTYIKPQGGSDSML